MSNRGLHLLELVPDDVFELIWQQLAIYNVSKIEQFIADFPELRGKVLRSIRRVDFGLESFSEDKLREYAARSYLREINLVGISCTIYNLKRWIDEIRSIHNLVDIGIIGVEDSHDVDTLIAFMIKRKTQNKKWITEFSLYQEDLSLGRIFYHDDAFAYNYDIHPTIKLMRDLVPKTLILYPGQPFRDGLLGYLPSIREIHYIVDPEHNEVIDVISDLITSVPEYDDIEHVFPTSIARVTYEEENREYYYGTPLTNLAEEEASFFIFTNIVAFDIPVDLESIEQYIYAFPNVKKWYIAPTQDAVNLESLAQEHPDLVFEVYDRQVTKEQVVYTEERAYKSGAFEDVSDLDQVSDESTD